jgi:CBS domain-containing protein
VISVVADALIRRMIELAIESKGTTPAEFAWLALGSHGRRETVPSSDVDSGMAWEDESEPGSSGSEPRRASEGVVGYMRTIAADVEDCIGVVGWRLDPHGVTASSEFSASSMDTWRRSIGHWLQNPGDEKVLIATSILLDGRTVYGPAELDPRAFLLEPANRATLLPSMLRLALALKLPTGFRGNIVVESSGEHSGTFDIKHGGLLPVVDIARFAALKAGAKVTTTIERLRAASELGALEPAHARTLEEAYDLFTALRLEHQIQQLERGDEPNDYVDPKELSELTRRYLRDAFREVAAVQKSLSSELV